MQLERVFFVCGFGYCFKQWILIVQTVILSVSRIYFVFDDDSVYLLANLDFGNLYTATRNIKEREEEKRKYSASTQLRSILLQTSGACNAFKLYL